ncbi:MAG: Hsp20/alpha crystallin family protein [Arenicella sp.]|nr:Hsp20/alpha crystallin family protein [Arenicella sp.]
MNLVNYEPIRAMSRLQDEINQFFRQGDHLPVFGDGSSVETSKWVPSVDIKDNGDEFLIKADIPGVAPQDIDVSMENGMLTIKGERKSEDKEEKNGYTRVECSYGSFYRRFSLPDTADSENIKAKGKDGVLEITVAKREPAKARKIAVKT